MKNEDMLKLNIQCIMNVQIKVIMIYSLTQRDTSKITVIIGKTNRREKLSKVICICVRSQRRSSQSNVFLCWC